MSRWFRHYAGMMRDDKLVRVAIESGQSVERVVWVWGAILESAAELDDEGSFVIAIAEISRFLRCKDAAIKSIVEALVSAGRIADGKIVKWQTRQYKSDRSAARVALHRERKRNDPAVTETLHETLPERYCNSPETETETETDTTDKSVVPAQRANRLPPNFEVPDEWRVWAVADRGWSNADALDESARFVDYWHAKSGRDATKLDWQATWRNWCRGSNRSTRQASSGYGPGHSGVPL